MIWVTIYFALSGTQTLIEFFSAAQLIHFHWCQNNLRAPPHLLFNDIKPKQNQDAFNFNNNIPPSIQLFSSFNNIQLRLPPSSPTTTPSTIDDFNFQHKITMLPPILLHSSFNNIHLLRFSSYHQLRQQLICNIQVKFPVSTISMEQLLFVYLTTTLLLHSPISMHFYFFSIFDFSRMLTSSQGKSLDRESFCFTDSHLLEILILFFFSIFQLTNYFSLNLIARFPSQWIRIYSFLLKYVFCIILLEHYIIFSLFCI